MAFTSPALNTGNASRLERGSRHTLWGLGAALCLAVANQAALAGGIEVLHATARLADGTYVLEADLRCELGERAQGALQSGIPLVLKLEIEVERPPSWRLPWRSILVTSERAFGLRQHALSGQFIVSEQGSEEQKSYPNLDAALAGLCRLRDLAIAPASELPEAAHLLARLRMGLSIESLPAPMRPLAYFGWGWELDSPWYVWAIDT